MDITAPATDVIGSIVPLVGLFFLVVAASVLGLGGGLINHFQAVA